MTEKGVASEVGSVKKKAVTHIIVQFAPKASCECDIFLNEED